MTLIQRFGSALNLNIHFHMLFLDGIYVIDSESNISHFQAIEAPTPMELRALLHRINERIGRLLEKEGFLTRDMEQSYLTMDGIEEDTMHHLQGSSITYRCH